MPRTNSLGKLIDTKAVGGLKTKLASRSGAGEVNGWVFWVPLRRQKTVRIDRR